MCNLLLLDDDGCLQSTACKRGRPMWLKQRSEDDSGCPEVLALVAKLQQKKAVEEAPPTLQQQWQQDWQPA